MFPRDIVCLRNIGINTLHEGDDDDDDDDDDDNNTGITFVFTFHMRCISNIKTLQ